MVFVRQDYRNCPHGFDELKKKTWLMASCISLFLRKSNPAEPGPRNRSHRPGRSVLYESRFTVFLLF